jgi:curved DNA-binding protein
VADRRDFYEVLGVGRTATADEIQRAYRKLARTYHPDVNKDPDADSRFKEVSEAYDVLSDLETRKRYDAFGHDFRRVPEDMDPDTFARAQAGAGRRAGAGETWTAGFGEGVGGFDDLDLDDLFGGMFGGRARRRTGSVAGPDQEAELTLTLDEAFRGGRKSITIGGPGRSRSIDVTIPPGVVDGQRIRLAGQGGRGARGGSPGDLYLRVRIEPHGRFRVDGRDLTVDLPLAPWEAALGASVTVDTPGGSATVKVPPGSSSGRRLRLRKRGMPNPRGEPGDLFAEVRIMVPKTLTDEERRLFDELAKTSTFDPRKRR